MDFSHIHLSDLVFVVVFAMMLVFECLNEDQSFKSITTHDGHDKPNNGDSLIDLILYFDPNMK